MEKVNHAPQENHVFLSIRQLTVSGLLAGITIFLGLTGYGFIPLIVMNATILHIPTIIGALVAGPKVGALVGFLFGLFSFIQTGRQVCFCSLPCSTILSMMLSSASFQGCASVSLHGSFINICPAGKAFVLVLPQ